jgi:hypothetical protein
MRTCEECHSPITDGTVRFEPDGNTYVEAEDMIYCDCCLTLLWSLRSCPGILEAHATWEQENQLRIAAKARMLSAQD